MSKSDNPTPTKENKQPRLDLQDQIQRAVILATQLSHAASKEHLDSTEWTANQVAANELLRTFENMQEGTAIEDLIATQIMLEVKMRIDALYKKSVSSAYVLSKEIDQHLEPGQTSSRERIARVALEKLDGVASVDLAVKVTEAIEAAILEEFHKGIDQKMHMYML
ncbi:unnamed protein product [Aureobasidium vineae]|uniref:Uncharacterized protein n=1 Tax=Aureobasidium vineae TaxID=2773715 RepID=A0A9N8JFJ8_9PEZI|nr:unnamed protein product [Aureobasidium vineae]